MGFDHRNTLDVAVRPDSVEGRALIEYLGGMGISFVACWEPIAGPRPAPTFVLAGPLDE